MCLLLGLVGGLDWRSEGGLVCEVLVGLVVWVPAGSLAGFCCGPVVRLLYVLVGLISVL